MTVIGRLPYSPIRWMLAKLDWRGPRRHAGCVECGTRGADGLLHEKDCHRQDRCTYQLPCARHGALNAWLRRFLAYWNLFLEIEARDDDELECEISIHVRQICGVRLETPFGVVHITHDDQPETGQGRWRIAINLLPMRASLYVREGETRWRCNLGAQIVESLEVET